MLFFVLSTCDKGVERDGGGEKSEKGGKLASNLLFVLLT